MNKKSGKVGQCWATRQRTETEKKEDRKYQMAVVLAYIAKWDSK